MHLGSVVRIPFGRRRARGFVTALLERSDFPDLKSLEGVVDTPPLFDASMLRLARWMADYYVAPFESAIAAILPAAVRREGARHKKQFIARLPGECTPTAADEAALARKALSLIHI